VRESGGPVTASTLASDMMRRAGAEDYVVDYHEDAASLGQRLYGFAMAREVHRLKRPSGQTFWRDSAEVPDGFTERDPTCEYLERDLLMVEALHRAGGDATAKAIIGELSAALGEPQRASNWSGSFVRLPQRGWVVAGPSPTYRLTWIGASVARLGRDLDRWSAVRDGDDTLLLSALASAVTEECDSVTFPGVARRFHCDSWKSPPTGHQVTQRLLRLERLGLAEKERGAKTTLLYWRPTAAGLKQLEAV